MTNDDLQQPQFLSVYDWGAGLIDRRATQRMRNLWAFPYKVQIERELWLAVTKAQQDLGFNIPTSAIDAYARSTDVPGQDLHRIRERELVVHHDVKARLEVFNQRASQEAGEDLQLAHLGMTGRDLDDNLELWLEKQSLDYLSQDLEARGHGALSADLARLSRKVRFRGIVGAVGTGQDQLTLFGGDRGALDDLNAAVASHLGFPPYAKLDSVGQVYPRSLDHIIASSLYATLLAAPVPPALRPSPFLITLRGYVNMLADLGGDQWAEGDVSCSSVRRVALPGAFLSASAHVGQTVDASSRG